MLDNIEGVTAGRLLAAERWCDLVLDADECRGHWKGPAALLDDGPVALRDLRGPAAEDPPRWILGHLQVTVTGLHRDGTVAPIDRLRPAAAARGRVPSRGKRRAPAGRGDTVTAGAGRDTLRYDRAAQSASTGFDVVRGFDSAFDRFDVRGSGAVLQSAAGALGNATLDTQLAASLGTANFI